MADQMPPETCGHACADQHTYYLDSCALSCQPILGSYAHPAWVATCPKCKAPPHQPCLRGNGTASTVVHEARCEAQDRLREGASRSAADDGTVGLREQYAAAINAKVDGTQGSANGHRLADAVLAVRDREMERLKLLVAASSEPGQAVRMAAQYADRAIENGERADRAEAAIASVRALPQTPQVQIQIHGIPGQDDYNRGWSSAISATRAALDKQPPTV
ncbi:hypothetical protein [Streptomyces sp. NRRL B-24720]|uniref:zinc finger domain-containing protein n=1 Tax=Streptomyces sp. NRRL B-24720 TaxID=1476876 RepID=UPI0004C552A8|nr:hypothetical protein [Streptomyces sp. NRRL B-24720]